MPAEKTALKFQQIHVEVARNATDDFNPFHDKNKWQRVHRNPFAGPIVLGFQLECLIEAQMHSYRTQHAEQALIQREKLRYSSYHFTFASAVHCDQEISIDIGRSRFHSKGIAGDDHRKGSGNATLSNRVSLKADGRLALLGYKRESRLPLYLDAPELAGLGDLRAAEDRNSLPEEPLFLKRKFMTNSNAKNFLCGSLVEQANYFDELEDRVSYPEIFPCSLISSALLEKARREDHDFERNPMVYTRHRICVDRQHLKTLRSNDSLHILVQQMAGPGPDQHYACFGVVGNERLLFRAMMALAPLEKILQ